MEQTLNLYKLLNLLKIIFLAFIAGVNLLSFFIILPDRLSFNIVYIGLAEYFFYFHIIQFFILVIFLIKKNNFSNLILLSLGIISILFLTKQNSVFTNFYYEKKVNIKAQYKDLSLSIVTKNILDQNVLSCFNNNLKKGTLIYSFKDILKFKSDKDYPNLKYINEIDLKIDNLKISHYKYGTLNFYYINTYYLENFDLFSRRASNYFRHKKNTLLFIQNFKVPFSIGYRRLTKGGKLKSVLSGTSYPHFLGERFIDHALVSKDIALKSQKFNKICGVYTYQFSF